MNTNQIPNGNRKPKTRAEMIEQAEKNAKWIKELNASGFAGIDPKRQGIIVDRRECPDAIPIQKNSMFGVVPPKPVLKPFEIHRQAKEIQMMLKYWDDNKFEQSPPGHLFQNLNTTKVLKKFLQTLIDQHPDQ